MSTAEAILDAALDLLERLGERRTTTNRIAAAAGISPGNLYYHYRHREAIVQALFRRHLRALAARRAADTARAPLAALGDDLRALRRAVAAQPGLFRALPELLVQDAALDADWRDWASTEHARLRRHLGALAADGGLTAPPALHAALAAALWQLATSGSYHAAPAGDEPATAEILCAPLAGWLTREAYRALLARLADDAAAGGYQSPQSSSSRPSDSS